MVIYNLDNSKYGSKSKYTLSQGVANINATKSSRSSGGGRSRVSQQELARREQEARASAAAKAEAIRLAEVAAMEAAQQQSLAEKRRIELLAARIKQVGNREALALSQEIARRRSALQQSLIQAGKNIGNKIVGGYDIISGGSVTEGRIIKKQQELNKEIDAFNKKYQGDLSESEYEKAMAINGRLTQTQNSINKEYNKLASSKKSKVYGFLNPLEKRLTLSETQKETDRLVSKTERDLINMKKDLANTNSKYKKAIFPGLIRSTERELERYRAGGRPIVFTGDLPIIPLTSVPTKITQVRFLGTQKKLSDGRTIVNIAYKTNAGRVGKAQGFVKSTGGKKSIGVVAGRSGTKFYRGVNTPKIRNVNTFTGVERSLSSPGVTNLKSQIGNMAMATKKAKVINQLSAGRVITTKGVKSSNLLRKGKMSFQDFISLSRSLTNKDLSFIAGKTLTSTKSRAKFVGIIRNIDKSGGPIVKLSGSEGRQVSAAVQKLVNSMAGSIAVAERTAQGSNKIGIASNLLRKISNNPKTFTPQVLNSPRLVAQKLVEKVVPKTRMTAQVVSPRQRAKAKQVSRIINLQQNKVSQLTRQLSRTKSKTKQRQISRQINRIKQQQRSSLRQLQRLNQMQRLSLARPSLNISTRTMPMRGIVPFRFKIPNGFSSRTLSKSVPVYYVKIKVRGRVVNLTPRPLTMKDARDFLAYKVDNGLSRSAWFEPMGKAKRVISVPGNVKGYFGRNSKKLRSYKFRMGKKIGIRMGFIEKRKYFNDRPGERTASRRLSRARPRPQRRKMSSQQRNILLKRLKFARMVRMRNLRRRR